MIFFFMYFVEFHMYICIVLFIIIYVLCRGVASPEFECTHLGFGHSIK